MLGLGYSKRLAHSALMVVALLLPATLEPRAAQLPAPGEAAVRAIRFRKLITMNGPAIDDAVVVVEGDRIRAVGHDVPSNAVVTDLRRYMGMPGLIDVHVHLSYAVERRPGRIHSPIGPRLSAYSLRKTMSVGPWSPV